MNPKYEILFTPTKIGSVELKNRFVMCAMESTGIINWLQGMGFNAKLRDLFLERAQDGVGLLIPGTIPLYSVPMHKWLYQNPKAFKGLSELMEEIHSYGSKMFIQLTAGFGRNFTMSQTFYKYRKLLKPVMDFETICAAPDEGLPNVWMPDYKTRQMTIEEIEHLVHAYAETAWLCKQNGIDGIEIHAVHEGYLMDQFTTAYTNHRTDKYGGSLENRYRFPCEVVKAIKARCGEDYPVILRYSVTSKVKAFNHGIVPGEDNASEVGRDMAESEQAIQLLREAGYDGFNCDNGTYDSWYWAHPPVYMPPNCNLEEAVHIKNFTDAAIGVAGRMTLDAAAEAIENGQLDFVGFARQFLTDEKFLTKIREGRTEDIRPCISCHSACLQIGCYKDSGAIITHGGDSVCALYPRTKSEKKYTARPAKKPKRIAIIGGGIAGMESALQLAARGHDVTLYEKSGSLGGVFIAAAAPSFKEKDKELLRWYRLQIEKSSVKVCMNTEIKELTELQADEIIIATGAAATRKLKVPGGEKCISAADFLLGKEQMGEKVAIIGGGLTGCEIAYELALQGKKPFIVEMMDDIIKVKGVSAANSNCLRDLIKYHEIPVHLETKTMEVKESSIVVEKNGQTEEIPADSVIVSIGYMAGNPFVEKKQKHIHILGDADHVANLKAAIWAANDLAINLSK